LTIGQEYWHSEPLGANPTMNRQLLISSYRRFIVYLRRYIQIFKTLFFTNDINRWNKVALETHKWDERNKIIASYIPSGVSVLDIGAGEQTLQKYLNDTEYVPCDIVQRSENILFCDLNKSIFPNINKRFDYVVCSGVFEYLIDAANVLRKLHELGDIIILSYAPFYKGDSKIIRVTNGWKNHFTKTEFENLFSNSDLTWQILGLWKDQYIYLLRKAK